MNSSIIDRLSRCLAKVFKPSKTHIRYVKNIKKKPTKPHCLNKYEIEELREQELLGTTKSCILLADAKRDILEFLL